MIMHSHPGMDAASQTRYARTYDKNTTAAFLIPFSVVPSALS
jgi:hypothetical protein